MSSLISLLETAAKNLYVIGGSILLIVGTVNCLFNLTIFMRKKLRKNPCSICLVAFIRSSFLLLYLSFLPAMFQIAFEIEPGSFNLTYCRFRYYLAFLFACLTPFYFILVSIDRAFQTSSNVRIRQWSNPSFVIVSLISLTLFWMLFHLHVFFCVKLFPVTSGSSFCYMDSGLYLVFISYYSLVINGLLPPILLAIFGGLTIGNLQHRRSQLDTRIRLYRNEKNEQFVRMLLAEVFISILFGFGQAAVRTMLC